MISARSNKRKENPFLIFLIEGILTKMKYFLLLCFVLTAKITFAQTCQFKELFTNSIKKSVINDYISECYQKHYFFDGKGVVQLITYVNSKEQECWRLSAIIDDRYKSFPPKYYSFYENDAIIIYEGDSTGVILPINNYVVSEQANCIQQILSGRLYNFTNEKQYVFINEDNGNLKKIAVTRIFGGNQNNELIIIFNKDGSINKFIPL